MLFSSISVVLSDVSPWEKFHGFPSPSQQGWLIVLAAAGALAIHARTVREPGFLARSFGTLFSVLFRPRHFAFALPTLFLAFAMAGVGIGMTIYRWHTGDGPDFAFGSWIPISDARGWWTCGKELEHAGAIASFQYDELCQRRAIYPAMVAELSALV